MRESLYCVNFHKKRRRDASNTDHIHTKIWWQ